MTAPPRTPAALPAAGAAGLLLTLANPPRSWGPLAFVALVPLLWALRGGRARRGAVLGFAFGFAYYGVLLSWILRFGVVAWLPLTVSQAAYGALFGAVAAVLSGRGRPLARALGVAAAWEGVDWARSVWPLGGFTWGVLGNTQLGNPLLLPLASVTGVWGVSFAVALVNAALLEAALALARPVRPWGRAAAVLAPAVGVALLPALIPLPFARGPALDVAVVQGNVPKERATDFFARALGVAGRHIRLNLRLASDPPDLVVWPENALDVDPEQDPALGARVRASIRVVGAPTLVGAVTEAPGGGFRNQVLLFSGRGELLGRYSKVHPVPFGEYVPFRRFLGWVDQLRAVPRDIVPGHGVAPFRVDGVRVGTPICFENTIPDLVRRFVARGAGLLVVATNDSSFLESPASAEHVAMSRMRAVETGRWVVQAAISGISAVIDPRGRVVASTGLFRQAILRHRVPTSEARTLYDRWGDWFPWACGIGTLLALAVLSARGRGRAPSPPPGERPAAALPLGAADTSEPSPHLGPTSIAPAPGPAPPGEGWPPAPTAPGMAGPPSIAGAEEPRVLVILPTYNERDTVGRVVEGVLAVWPEARVLVVDDGSPDGTAEVVRELARRDHRVGLVERPAKQGLASAYLLGFRRALEEGFDVAVEMDADLSHRPEDLPRLLEGAARYDLTIGSRYVPGGGVSNWSRARVALSRAGNLYARLVLGLPLSDATSGYRAFRRPLLEALLPDGIASDGYAFQIELAYRAWRSGFRVGEVPIVFREREHGRSKISRRIVAEALLNVARWGLRDRVLGRPAGRPLPRPRSNGGPIPHKGGYGK